MAWFSVCSLRVAIKTALRCVAKPCRGTAPAAFRALLMTVLTRNASPKISVNRALDHARDNVDAHRNNCDVEDKSQNAMN